MVIAVAQPAYDPRRAARRRERSCKHGAPVTALTRRHAFAAGGGSLHGWTLHPAIFRVGVWKDGRLEKKMNISGLVRTGVFPDRAPNRQCWLLFRASSLSRLRDFQQGKMYMNSVQYFSDLEGEVSQGLRGDLLEKKYLKLHSKINEKKVGGIFIEINGKEIPLGDDASLYLDLPNPKNVFVFCMAAIADGPDGIIPGEKDGKVQLSERFLEFGDHVLIVKNNAEFSRRLNSAIASHPHLYGGECFEGGYGQVEYVDMAVHNGVVGLFRKDRAYSWQREYRICFGAGAEALNENGALELNIGDLTDITQIVSTQQFISEPLILRRGVIKKVDGEMVHKYI